MPRFRRTRRDPKTEAGASELICSRIPISSILMPALVECVPNFSEGRDKAKVDAILEAMKMDGVYLLDREMDADHNRCVITLVGDPVNVAEAAIRGVGKAAELIDLTKHTGAHPRLGAADVIPFIPIEGVTLEDCVAIARRVGEEIWKRYKVPVYLYEAAAQKPERQNLEEHSARTVRRHSRRHKNQPATASPISARQRCIRRRERPLSARANFWWPITST